MGTTMNFNQVVEKWSTDIHFCEPRNNYYFLLDSTIESVTTKAKKHQQKMLMDLGRKLPGNKNHASYWIKNGCVYGMIYHELQSFVKYCRMIGFEPTFTFTKSKRFVRLVDGQSAILTQKIKEYFGV